MKNSVCLLSKLSFSIFLTCSLIVLIAGCKSERNNIGVTSITKWYQNKQGAISITYDDATINQFRQALPIMDTLGFKGTFFINTADIPDSKFPPKFIGRNLKEIIEESEKIPTSETNLFERASALRFFDIPNAIELHNQAGSLYENGKIKEAIATVEEGLSAVRKKRSFKEVRPVLLTGEVITWPEIVSFAKDGHEFGNHTISHPRLAVLDEPNLLYEIEKCKEEIFYQLGQKHIFSCECPFGTENERVMEYAYKIHPALRNRMPEPFLEEINRWGTMNPFQSEKEYVQWQRGPLQKTTMPLMKSWVDTLMVHDNVWLVLTFHGVDGVGWEAKPHEELKEYFSYMKQKEEQLWVATFGDVTRYIRQRINTKAKTAITGDQITVTLERKLSDSFYDHKLTLQTIVPAEWKQASIRQGELTSDVTVEKNGTTAYVTYNVTYNDSPIEITQLVK